MLDELHVRDIALIADAEIEFSPGLTVLTGETGAGKTALLCALKLVCGRRADSKAVRDGAREACAEARFLAAGEEHIVRRRVNAQGRSRCTLDGAMATVSELADATAGIRMHSQHEQVALLQPAVQLSYLDAWIDADTAHLSPYLEARDAWQRAAAALAELEDESAAAAGELELFRFALAQIDELSPEEGEYERLESELPRLRHAEQLAEAVSCALQALHADGAAGDLMAQAGQTLARQRGIDPALDELAERLDLLGEQAEDLARDLAAYAEGVEHDPHRLAEVLDRLDALSGLAKRFGPGMEQVLATREKARRALAAADAGPEHLESARGEEARARSVYEAAAAELANRRRDAAQSFCAELAASLAELAMGDACLEFSFEDLPFERWTDAGPQRAELLYRPAPAAAARPMSRIASGGELSRMLLALECMHRAHAAGSDDVLVFDEVDAGIGGATANAVAARLAALAENAQVVVVTHLAQVAARADMHYVVEKHGDGTSVETTVVRVGGAARVAEIARMLAGGTDETALEHARSLLAAAAGAQAASVEEANAKGAGGDE